MFPCNIDSKHDIFLLKVPLSTLTSFGVKLTSLLESANMIYGEAD